MNRPHSQDRCRQRGLALVLVLAFLVLISALVVSFLTSVNTEFTAAKNFADGVSTRQLADSAVSVVMAQIREATSRADGAWASQPGMIRVYRDGSSASPKADAFFKLYSSDSMTVTAGQIASFDPLEDDVLMTWREDPALFTDLNAPVAVVSPGNPTATPVKHYPIIDPGAAGEVEGLQFLTDERDDAAEPGRMPARWIYVLRDGTLTAPDRKLSAGTQARWNATGTIYKRPTRDNPIVGRVAFWTDDETSKVNINTAAGMEGDSANGSPGATDAKFAGAYWDTPRMETEFEKGQVDPKTGAVLIPSLALCQPGQKEFQRYPGHPATTSLGLVFGKQLTSEQLYQIVPRVIGGGSKGGTVGGTGALSASLAPDSDRLYASVDELMFGPKSIGALRETTDQRLGSATPKLTEDVLNKRRFFLTAHSRAPELNLYGRPRLTIWPFYEKPNANAASENYRTSYDKLIAFCSTIGGKRFLFSRYDPYSPTNDALVPRNLELYTYLRDLTSRKIPGFGGSFAQKYQSGAANDRDQILTEIFDYIRCVNLRDSSGDQAGDTNAVLDARRYAPLGIVVPTQIKDRNTTGFGRFSTISEAALIFYRAKRQAGDPAGSVRMRAFLIFETFNPMQGYTDMRSPNSKATRTVHEVTGLQNFKVQTESMPDGAQLLGFPSIAINEIYRSSGNTWHGRNFGGNEGFMHTLQGKPGGDPYKIATPNPGILIPAADVAKGFKLFGATVTLKVQFNGYLVQTVTLKFPDSSHAANWPVPTEDYDRANGGSFFKTGVPDDVYDVEKRIRWAAQDSFEKPTDHRFRWQQIIQPGDTIRSLEVAGGAPGSGTDPRAGGDMRVTAVLDAVDRLVPHAEYFKGVPTNTKWAHSLRTTLGVRYHVDASAKAFPWTKIKFGNIVALPPGQSYPESVAADIPLQINGVTRTDGQPGDFDNGIGKFPDGPFCNKVDEGNNVFKYQRLGEDVYPIPYFGTEQFVPPGETYFSPNRQIPSAVMFGSLLSRNASNQPWETLVFSPNPAGAGHRGNTITPKDHLLLDLFNMPVVEPYAISEPFSTAGKVNLNYPIAPYGYIHRSTALRAALQACRVTAIPSNAYGSYKSNSSANFRLEVDRDETIKAFDHFFGRYKTDRDGGFFKSTSEICDRFIYPKGVEFDNSDTEASIVNWWKNQTLTGDNLREKPYADLYPRLTTKSNTYTVHLRVQALRKRPAPSGAQGADEHYASWDEDKDPVVGEYRGSSTIERYLDPADRRFDRNHSVTVERKDYLDVDKVSLEDAYRFRVISTKKFAP